MRIGVVPGTAYRILVGCLLAVVFARAETIPRVIPGSTRLSLPPDWREQQRRQILDYLDRRLKSAPDMRARTWKSALGSRSLFVAKAKEQRRKLADLAGYSEPKVRDVKKTSIRPGVEQWAVRSDSGLLAYALIYSPKAAATEAVVAVPDSTDGFPVLLDIPKTVAEGAAVAVLVTVPRDSNHKLSETYRGLDRRRMMYRLSFTVGESLPGLEAEQASLLRAALQKDGKPRVSISGNGQGGMTALLAAALDPAFASAEVAGYFGSHVDPTAEPVDRMLYGKSQQFGDAELAALIAPRALHLIQPGPSNEGDRARLYYKASGQPAALQMVNETTSSKPTALEKELVDRNFEAAYKYIRSRIDHSEAERDRFWASRFQGASNLEKPARIRRDLRQWMGVPQEQSAAMSPRSRLLLITDKYAAYEVMLGVLPGMEVYGHLLIPRNHAGRLPAVVCQHGLDGQPKDVSGAGPKPNMVYHEFGRKLAERGFVVFAPYLTVPAPQAELINPIVRKAAALGMLRTAIEVRKLSRVVDYLQSLPQVDPNRIGYYGLSYGGYSAIWMGPLEERLKTVIVSGHFNDWRSKITNDDLRTSYMMHPDEDFFNFNVLHRFTHPELIAAMLPRAVMVEFADQDATTTPEWHERAWKQTVALTASLGATGQVERDVFAGVHEIGGMRTLDWLDQWLRPEQSPAREYSYLLWPSGRELPGIADNAADTYPFDQLTLEKGEPAAVQDHVKLESGRTRFHGLAFRLSRKEHPGALWVKYGTTEGSSDLGSVEIPPASIYPLYDLWYEARVPEKAVKPGSRIFFRVENRNAEHGGYQVYGPKPLGGHSYPKSFYAAYQLLNSSPLKTGGSFEFVRSYLEPPQVGAFQSQSGNSGDDVPLTADWSIESNTGGAVVSTAIEGFKSFVKSCCDTSLAAKGQHEMKLTLAANEPGVTSPEGFRIRTSKSGVEVRARTERGLMRGLYELENRMRARRAALLRSGETVSNERFARRITTSILPGGQRYTETSRTLLYTPGLLERMSRDGFNAIWIWINTEEAATRSAVFPELNDPEADTRFARIQELTEMAARYGIDVYLYLATGYNHFVPESFYKKYPEVKGVGFGSPMCTSDERVRRYHAEIVEHLVKAAPGIKGLVIIYDHEGFYYCGNTEGHREQCPRCRRFTSPQLALQVIENLNGALQKAAPGKEFIAWSYGTESWVDEVIPKLPRNVKVQVDFSKGGEVVRDGIHHRTGDYNLTLIGPPDFFERRNAMTKQLGLDFITKTEHAVSQEFIFVPYIPAMEQWYRRIEKIRQYPAAGWFGNWSHYGYLASLPAQLINRMSFDPQPESGEVLRNLALTNYGEAAAPLVLQAWNEFSEGIRQFPYSDSVSRLPGPLQKGPSNPLFLDPSVKNFGAWRAWQNDLAWTKPWGPKIAAKYLTIVRDHYRRGAGDLEKAAKTAQEPSHRAALEGDWRIARIIDASLTSCLNLIDWLQTRDRLTTAANAETRKKAADQLRLIAERERANAYTILPVLEKDSRLGYASEGGGVLRGGLFTPDLVRWKIGQLDDVLHRQLPEYLDQVASQ